MTPRASFRLFRTGLIGSIVLGLAAGAHSAGGGELPALPLLAAVCAATMVPIAALTRFRLSFPLLTGVIGAGQLWLHWAFDSLAAGSPPSLAVTAAMLTGHADHAGHSLPTRAADALAITAAPAHTGSPDALMTLAHVVATLATALLLARGERALSILASWFEPLLQTTAPAIILPPREPRLSVLMVVVPSSQPTLLLPSRRGPPLGAFAA